MQNFNTFPEDVILEILSLVPATDLIHCRRVCTLWRDVIDSPTLWKTKCYRIGYLPRGHKRHPTDWKVYYRLCSLKTNLLWNTCAAEGFKYWKIDENGGDQWKIEELPGEHGQGLPSENATKFFVTSYGSCKKSQRIELKKKGYSDNLMDLIQPDIVIKDWFAARADCGCMYEVVIRLLSKNKETIQEYHPEAVYIEQWSDAKWRQMTHTFRNYGPGVRYIYFQHGGKDTQFWAGWYGIRVTDSSITIEPEDLQA
uniref:F-box protein 44 n=1 Tax=Leptobrachium leishanense TaxID=445787 RepID=A0A8C5QFR2_9ANUR